MASRTYAFYARSVPVYVVLLPIAIGASVWFPDIAIIERLGAVVISPGALAILLGEMGRDSGRRKQRTLWRAWGGPLITQYLRHRDQEINRHLKLGYHSKLGELLPNLVIPAEVEELADPEAADVVYDTCAQHIVNIVREDPGRFPSAFTENRSYGFRRNLWGLKPLGVACSVAGFLGAGAGLFAGWNGPVTMSFTLLVAPLTCGGMLTLWLFVVTSKWVRVSANAYARRVLESLPKMNEGDAL